MSSRSPSIFTSKDNLLLLLLLLLLTEWLRPRSTHYRFALLSLFIVDGSAVELFEPGDPSRDLKAIVLLDSVSSADAAYLILDKTIWVGEGMDKGDEKTQYHKYRNEQTVSLCASWIGLPTKRSSSSLETSLNLSNSVHLAIRLLLPACLQSDKQH